MADDPAPPPTGGCATPSSSVRSAVRSFWFLGLLNNSPWVLFLACATDISSGGVALVFLANQIPGLVVKLSAPYWFHRASYRARLDAASLAMCIACLLVGYGGQLRDNTLGSVGDNASGDGNYADENVQREIREEDGGGDSLGLALQLFGVCFVSFQCSLGEASLLALAGRFDSLVIPSLMKTTSLPDGNSGQLVDNNGRVSGGEFAEEYVNFARGPNSDELEGSILQSHGIQEINGDGDMSVNESTIQQQQTETGRRCITAFSSGTGIAGVVGYAYKAFFSGVMGWSLSSIVWSAMLFSLAYWLVYRLGLGDLVESGTGAGIHDEVESDSEPRNYGLTSSNQELRSMPRGQSDCNHQHMSRSPRQASASPLLGGKIDEVQTSFEDKSFSGNGTELAGQATPNIEDCVTLQSFEMTNDQLFLDFSETPPSPSTHHTGDGAVACLDPKQATTLQRLKLVLSLWPYTIPLFTVYAAEYMLQAGVWSAIGFPMSSAGARAEFYQYSNWTYQAGVFVSRSSGNLFTASVRLLWLMPFLQVLNLIFFYFVSIHHFWYGYIFLIPFCFFAGMLGGSVYVQGFSRINMDMPLELREFAISSASVADAMGIMFADVCALFIQSCIYDRNGIEGAVVKCMHRS